MKGEPNNSLFKIDRPYIKARGGFMRPGAN